MSSESLTNASRPDIITAIHVDNSIKIRNALSHRDAAEYLKSLNVPLNVAYRVLLTNKYRKAKVSLQ